MVMLGAGRVRAGYFTRYICSWSQEKNLFLTVSIFFLLFLVLQSSIVVPSQNIYVHVLSP